MRKCLYGVTDVIWDLETTHGPASLIGSHIVMSSWKKKLQIVLSLEITFRGKFHLRCMCVTRSSMRKELYYYIPGGRVDDVCGILNVTY